MNAGRDVSVSKQGRGQREIEWRLNPLSLLGALGGALSLIKLIEDLDFVEIYGLLGKWFESWSVLTSYLILPAELIRRFIVKMFDDQDMSWMVITSLEKNIIVLVVLVVMAIARGIMQYKLKKEDSWGVGVSLPLEMGFFFFVFPVFVLSLLLHNSWFILMPLLVLGAMVHFIVFDQEDDASEYVRSSFVQTTALIAIILILNYAVFRHA